MTTLSVRLLGALELHLDSERLALPSRAKERALLAYLAAHPREPCSRSHLGDLFWPDHSAAKARNNLRQVLHNLRKLLATPPQLPDPFQTDRSRVAWSPDLHVQTDLQQILALQGQGGSGALSTDEAELARAVTRYRGAFLADLDAPPDLEEFQEWLSATRRHFHNLALRLLDRLIDVQEGHGALQAAVDSARRRVELAPEEELGHRRLMGLLAQCGDVNAALRQYEECRRILDAELSTEPVKATRDLRARILGGQIPSRSGPDSPAQDSHGLAPEWRQVTVVALSCAWPPDSSAEDSARAFDRILGGASHLLRYRKGHVLRPYGRTLLAYFGYPAAREQGSLEAVSAALDILQDTELAPRVHIGVHTGSLLTGQDPDTPDPAGTITERALALRDRAESGCIVASPEILRLHRSCFRFEPLPEDGFWLIPEAPPHVNLGPTEPFVGRHRELEHLRTIAREVRQRGTRAVLVEGEPGIGKSRLLQETAFELRNRENFLVREMQCRETIRSDPFGPVAGLLRQLAGLHDIATGTEARRRLAAYLDTLPGLTSGAFALLARLLGMEESVPPRLEPWQERQSLLEICLELIAQRTANHPVTMILEDYQWADSGTRSLVHQVVSYLQDLPVLILVSARPGAAADLPDAFQRLSLGPLDDRSSRQLLAEDGAAPLPDEADRILRKAEGVPLFLKELSRAAQEEGKPGISTPSTFQELLEARLERVGPAKRIAQLASVLDREVSEAWLAALTTLDPETLSGQLDQLLEAELLDPVSVSGQPGYRFRHVLYQEAAYRTLPKADRREIHRRIVEIFQTQRTEEAARWPQAVAHHAEAGGLPETALTNRLRAGFAALESTSNQEARTHFRAASALLEHLPEAPLKNDATIQTHLGLGLTALTLSGYGSIEARHEFRAALARLPDGADHDRTRFQILWGLWLGASSHSGYREARGIAEQQLTLANRMADPALQAAANLALGNTACMTGRPLQALPHLETAVQCFGSTEHALLVRSFGENPCVSAFAFRAWAESWQGRTTRAETTMAATLDRARSLDHPPTLAFALTFAGLLAFFHGTPEEAEPNIAELRAIAHRYHFQLWEAAGEALQGWFEATQHQQRGITRVEASLDLMRKAMPGTATPFLALLVSAQLHCDSRQRTLETVGKLETTMTSIGDFFYLPEVLRIGGRLRAGNGRDRLGRALLWRAYKCAESRGMGLFQLRAAGDLADLADHEAQQALEAALGTIPAGEDGPDIRRARRHCDPSLNA
ncbi:AAA family ATPase [Thiohalorhabdus methylotrophus]|uniref:AAA family ATPase n=1 Tax=Thiohalorhabdus methylotrophus TaxID=3242694 RepID=A0ABV4U265_9GAMM